MNWAAKCVRAARVHMQHLIALTRGLRWRQHRIRIPVAARKDLLWWAHFATRFNGVSHWHSHVALSDHMVAIDASLSGGARRRLFINQLAVWWASIIGCVNKHSGNVHNPTGAQALGGHLVHLYTDSNVALYTIGKGRLNNDIGMDVIQEIHLILATYDICLELKRINTKDNSFAYALSRIDNVKFAYHAFSMLLDPDLHRCQVICSPLIHTTLQSWFYLL